MNGSLEQPTTWMVNGPLLVLYAAAPALVLLVRRLNDFLCMRTAKEKPLPPVAIAVLTCVSNVLAVASLAALANVLSSSVRLSMLAAPLLLLLEHHVKIARREPRNRRAHLTALIGSVAGLALGTAIFLRAIETTEPLSRATINPDAPTLPLSAFPKDASTISVGLELVVFYLAAIALFLGVHALVKRTASRLLTCPAEKRRQRTAVSILLAFALNFAGVALLVFAAGWADTEIRLAMVALPLLIIVESYAELLRSDPRKRPAHWTGLIGSTAGIVVATVFLLRGAPLH